MVAGPRRRKAACLSTAGKAEERKAIAQKTDTVLWAKCGKTENGENNRFQDV